MFITIFTDASFCHYTKATGWAVWIKYGVNGTIVKHQGGFISKKGKHSNDAELFALDMSIDMCRLLYEHNRMDLKDKIVVIQSDCQGALDKTDTSTLYKRGVHYVKKKWVKGHSNGEDSRSKVNDWCDTTAFSEMKKLRRVVQKGHADIQKQKRKL